MNKTTHFPIASPTAFLIFGMHRSGTSAFAGLLKTAGIPMGDSLMPAAYDNPQGFYEHEAVVALNEKILNILGHSWDTIFTLPDNWLGQKEMIPLKKEAKQFLQNEFGQSAIFALKDPRFSLTLPFWRPIFAELNIQIRPIILIRHPYEIAASLWKRNQLPQLTALALWAKYIVAAVDNTQELNPQFVCYEQVLKQPAVTLQRTKIPFDKAALKASNFINPALRHNHAQAKITEPFIAAIYQAVRTRSDNEASTNHLTLQSIVQQFPDAPQWMPAKHWQATLAIDYGKGLLERPPLTVAINGDTEVLVFSVETQNGTALKGQFRPANTWASLKIGEIEGETVSGGKIVIPNATNQVVINHENWLVVNADSSIAFYFPTSPTLKTIHITIQYLKIGDWAIQDIQKIGQAIQQNGPNPSVGPATTNSTNPPKTKFWLDFLKTGLSSPFAFLKNINLQNFKTLQKALLNEPPSVILSNLKKLLLNQRNTTNTWTPPTTNRADAPLDFAAIQKRLKCPLAELPARQQKGTVLYFASNLPDFDQSSGGKRAFRYLSLLAEEMQVLVYALLPPNPKHKVRLEENHIQVLSNVGYDQIHRQFPELKAIICSTYTIFAEVENLIHYFPNAITIVDTVDVHWIREERSLGLIEGLTQERIQTNKAQEIAVYRKADRVWAVTETDKQAILKELPTAPIDIVSNVHEQQVAEYRDNGKHTLLFFGNYQHLPNISAAKTLALDIFPKVKQVVPEAELILAGAKAPKEIQDLGQLAGVTFKGFIEEAEIAALYKNTFLSVSPLLAGAGIKGKICEAIAYRTPIVTNDIGNEGLNLIPEKEGLIVAIEEMAEVISKALRREWDFEEMTKRAARKMAQLVGPSGVKQNMLRAIFPEVSICIVTHNRLDLLRPCLAAIEQFTHYPHYKILVYSNACTDGTVDYLKKIATQDERIKPIFSATNEVFVRPNNRMMQTFPENDVVLLNNDTEVTENWLLELQRAAYASTHFGVSGAKILFPDGRLQEFGAEIYAHGNGQNIGRGAAPNQAAYQTLKQVGYVSGCAMYIKRSTIEKIGVFDDQYHPCYYEDSDYCYTALEQGLSTVVTPHSVVYHKEGSTAGKDTSTGFKKYQTINRAKFVQKHYGKPNGIAWNGVGTAAEVEKEGDAFKVGDTLKVSPSLSKAISPLTWIENYKAYLNYQKQQQIIERQRADWLAQLMPENQTHFKYAGLNPMLKEAEKVQYSVVQPSNGTLNVRESFICPKTESNCRLRATALVINHFLQDFPSDAAVYFTEATTPFFKHYQKQFPNIIGSEYLGTHIPFGTSNRKGIRNEDLTKLTFDSESFDALVCLEVLEHIPDYKKALQEIFRVLKPNGTLILTVPFILDNPQTLVRATLQGNGQIEHHLPPEYHGDPVNPKGGILCYYHFGWDLLAETMQEIGFEAGLGLVWSKKYAIFSNKGRPIPVFYAKKPQA